MKILFVSHDDGKYGAALCLMSMIAILKDKTDIVPVVTTRCNNEVNRFCVDLGIENYVLPYVSCVTYYTTDKWNQKYHCIKQSIKNELCNFIAIEKLKNHIDISSLDAIYTNVSTINFGSVLAQKYKIPYFWHIREFGIGSVPASPNFYKLMNHANKVFAISNGVRDCWIKKGINQNKIITIYDGIEQKNIIINSNKTYTNKKLKLIFVGSAAPLKGLEHLIEAVYLLHTKSSVDFNLDVYGDYSNEYGSYIKNRVDQLSISEVVSFKGFDYNLKDKLYQYDVGLICTQAEGFGRVTVEYMMAGIVVIASNTGANVELVEDGVNGVLYSYGDSKNLMEKISWLNNNRTKLEKMALEGCFIARNKYTAERNADVVYTEVKKYL